MSSAKMANTICIDVSPNQVSPCYKKAPFDYQFLPVFHEYSAASRMAVCWLYLRVPIVKFVELG